MANWIFTTPTVREAPFAVSKDGDSEVVLQSRPRRR